MGWTAPLDGAGRYAEARVTPSEALEWPVIRSRYIDSPAADW